MKKYSFFGIIIWCLCACLRVAAQEATLPGHFSGDGDVLTANLSHICLVNQQQTQNRYDFGCNTPFQLSVRCSDFSYSKGWGSDLPNQMLALEFDLVDANTKRVIRSFQPFVNGGTEAFIYPDKEESVSLGSGLYAIVFNGWTDNLLIPVGPPVDYDAKSLIPPPTCCVSVALTATFMPLDDDPRVGGGESIPVCDRTFPVDPLPLDWSEGNAVCAFTSTDGTLSRGNLDVNYYDDFGRLQQTVRRNFANGKALVAMSEYDIRNNVSRAWLPAAVTQTDAGYVAKSTLREKCLQTYPGDTVCYSVFDFEPSSLNRPVWQRGPGEDWKAAGKGVTTTYMTNLSGNDSLGCLKLYAGPFQGNYQIFDTGSYPSGKLHVTRIMNEDKSCAYEFKDFDGRVLLTRQMAYSSSGVSYFDTYYLYDDFGRLTAVVPPTLADDFRSGAAALNAEDYAYFYRYDNADHLIASKEPDSGWTYFVYDRAGRAIFSQTANQRDRGEWTFRIADKQGRECLMGTCTNKFDPFTEPVLSNYIGSVYVGSGGRYNGYKVYGTFLDSAVVHTANYYDQYHFLDAGLIPAPDGFQFAATSGFPAPHTCARGLLTGSATSYFDNTGVLGYEYRSLYYDSRDRVIQTCFRSHLGEVTTESVSYNFPGLPVMRSVVFFERETTPGGGLIKRTHSELYAYTYDPQGRLLTTTHSLDNGTAVTLVDNVYDDLGRLVKNKRNATPGLITDYGYNIRSWTTSILGPLFSERLYYQDAAASGSGATPSYGGNISAMSWTLPGDKTRMYGYTYDPLSRLTRARYFENGSYSGRYDTAYTYDKQCNITSLTRSGRLSANAYGVLDDLRLIYDGNRLSKIHDVALTPASLSRSLDFTVEQESSEAFRYDKNGNLTRDLSRGISNISYNLLNLPSSLTISNRMGTGTNTYRYSSDGRKLQVRKQEGFDITTTDYVGTRLYENGSLKRLLIDGGYIEGGNYYFYLTDHLGSTRVVAKADGTIMQTNHYYPYGLTFAEGIEDSNQRYKFNGKEFDTDLGLNYYDFGARLQDPVLGGRFGSRDPMARKYYPISPYAYCAGNPVKRIDPTGKIWVDKEGRPMWANGKYTQYASPEFMRAGNTAMATPTGKKAFNRIARGPGKTGFEVSPDIKYGKNGNLVRGEHALNIVYNVNGNYEIGISKVTIYKGSIEAEVTGTVKSEGETAGLIESLPAKDAVDGATASVLVHESGHGTSENLKQNEANKQAGDKGLPKPYDLEKAPEAEQNQFLQELLFLLRGY